ncbi:MAG: D-tyrosyl-tRNA(Tyr) deacylase [Methylophaga sp.]|nr:MAG: D-tyrosyl-tRNA(Tyr) deacylase [Methylophaga sp.]
MIGLLQRVQRANVDIANKQVAKIGKGLLVLIGIEHHDSERQADRLLSRLLGYRIFSDNEDKMNLSLQDINGGLLLVPQFTLVANTQKGMRPSFSSAAVPEQGRILFEYLCLQAKQQYHTVQSGIFATDMQVSLTNDGPVTFWLQVPPNTPPGQKS